MFKEYELVTGDNNETLESKSRIIMKHGLLPTGGVYIQESKYYQSFYKPQV